MLNKWIKYWRQGGSAPSTDGLTTTERKELDQIERLWRKADLPESKLKVDTTAAWGKMEDRLFGDVALADTPVRQLIPRSRKRAIPAWAAAAALVGVALFGWWLIRGTAELPETQWVAEANLEEAARLVRLPDGSEVWINTGSEIRFAEAFEERRVELEGEAFFDVVRDESSPFVVITGDLETRVLGTSFNVRAYAEEEVEVSVKTGRVEVAAVEEATARVKKRIVLTPGQAATYEVATEDLSEAEEAIEAVNIWTQSEVLFESGSSYAEVIESISRYYSKTLVIAEGVSLDCVLGPGETVLASKDDEVEMVLSEVVFFSGDGLELEVQGDNIILNGTCQ